MLTNNDRIPFGTKRGEILQYISNAYLHTLYDRQRDQLPKNLIDYIEDRIPELRMKKKSAG